MTTQSHLGECDEASHRLPQKPASILTATGAQLGPAAPNHRPDTRSFCPQRSVTSQRPAQLGVSPRGSPPPAAHPCASAGFPAVCNAEPPTPSSPSSLQSLLSIFSSHKPSLGINGPSSLQPPSAKFTKSLPADASFSRSWQWDWGRLGLPFRLQHTAPTGPASW